MTRDIHESPREPSARLTAAAAIRHKIKRDIRTAWIVSHTRRDAGCWPASYQSSMPEVVRDFFESYGLEREKIGTLPPSGAQIDIHDAVHAAICTVRLSDHDRLLLWARASKVGWKDIIKKTYIPERTLKRHYSQALMIFGIAYGLVRPKRADDNRHAA